MNKHFYLSLDDWRMKVMKCVNVLFCTMDIPHASIYFLFLNVKFFENPVVFCTSQSDGDMCSAEHGKGSAYASLLIVPFIHSADIFGCGMCKVLYFVLLEIKNLEYKANLQGAIEPKAKNSRFLSFLMMNKSMYSQSLHFCQRGQ